MRSFQKGKFHIANLFKKLTKIHVSCQSCQGLVWKVFLEQGCVESWIDPHWMPFPALGYLLYVPFVSLCVLPFNSISQNVLTQYTCLSREDMVTIPFICHRRCWAPRMSWFKCQLGWIVNYCANRLQSALGRITFSWMWIYAFFGSSWIERLLCDYQAR